MYSIKDIAEKFNIATSTIRYYEKEGLLPLIERKESGIRYFTDHDIEWLEFVMMLVDTKMPIKEIKVYVDNLYNNNDNEKCLELFKNHLDNVNKQITLFQKSITKINYTIWELEKKIKTED